MNLNQITVPSLDLNKSILFYEKYGNQLILFYGGAHRLNPPWRV